MKEKTDGMFRDIEMMRKKISELQSQVRMYEELMRGFKDQIDKLDLLQVVKPPSADDASPYS